VDREFQLVRKIVAGDAGRFAELIQLYQRLVAHIVFRMVSAEVDREELCQEIFIKIYQNLESFNFNAKLSTWIAKIAHNHCINFLRKHKLNLLDDMQPQDGDNITHEYADSMFGRTETPDVMSEKAECIRAVHAHLEKLPEIYRLLLTLYHLDELSYQDIAGVVDMPEGTVKSYLFRARKMLKDKLVANYKKEEALWQ